MVCVVRVVMVFSSGEARNRPSCFSFSNRKSVLPVNRLSAAGSIPGFEQSDMCAGSALDTFAIENSVVIGGVSDTARSQVCQINEVCIWELPLTFARIDQIIFH